MPGMCKRRITRRFCTVVTTRKTKTPIVVLIWRGPPVFLQAVVEAAAPPEPAPLEPVETAPTVAVAPSGCAAAIAHRNLGRAGRG